MGKIKFLTTFALVVLFLYSCADNALSPEKTQISFSINQLSDALAKSEIIYELDDVDKAIITLKQDGSIILDNVEVELINWGQSGVYRTDIIEVNAGIEYTLDQFELRDSNNVTLFAAPLDVSPLAFMVEDPLPISVSVTSNEQKAINVEVLSTDGYTPEDFGYPYFVVVDKTMLPFSVTVKADGNLTTADLIVLYSDSIYSQSLAAGNNNILINKDSISYTVIVQKDGYVPFKEIFTEDELWNKHFYIELQPVDIDLYTLLLLNGDGVQGQTVFADNSLYHRVITRYGDVITDTSAKKFGSASIYFDGDGDYLTIPQSEDFNFGIQDFTIEFWANFKTIPSNGWAGLVSSRNQYSDAAFSVLYQNYDGIKKIIGQLNDNGTIPVAKELDPTLNQWYHFALVRNVNNLYLFIDGQLESVLTTNNLFEVRDLNTLISIGSLGEAGSFSFFFNGNIDNLRICKGIARWTKNFTPCE